MLTHSFTGPHTHILLQTLTLTGTLTFTQTHKQLHTHTHTHMHSKCILTLACILKSMHTCICRHTLIHHTRRGARAGCQLWHYGPQPEAEEDPLHPEHTRPPGAPHPEHCASAPPGSRRGCAKARPRMALAGLQALSCPCQAAPALVFLRSREAPLASHLGFGRASASWLPRLTRRWAGASSELSERRRRKGRAGRRDRAAPPPASRPEQTLFSHPF